MTLQDFKDQVARDEATIPGTKLRDWTDWKGFKDKMHTLGYDYEKWSDRAAELYAKDREDDGYKAGYTDAYEGRPHKFAVQKDWGDELPY